MKIHRPRTSCLRVPKKGTDKENSEVAPSDQTEQTTEKNSVPSTPGVPSEPQAKETSEQVASEPSKSKTESKEQKPEVQSATDKITSSPAGSNTRIMAFTELADGEHTVNGKTFTKKGNAFTLDGKTLNAKETEKDTRTKTEKIKAMPKAETETASGKKSDKSNKSERIEDYGEKIGDTFQSLFNTIDEKVDESGNTALFSTVGDKKQNATEILSQSGDMDISQMALHQTEAQIKITDELLHFRDLPRGQARDNAFVAAVRQLLDNNVELFPEKIKVGFVKFFDSLISLKPPLGMNPITPENFVTSATAAGLLREEGGSAYLTIGNNTLRVSHHNTSAKTFEKHGETGNNILSVVFEKANNKFFKGKSNVNAVEYVYKNDELDGVKPALIWYDMSAFFKTGIYTDHVGANYVHYSGSAEFKEAAKKKVEADKEALYQNADTDLKFSLPTDLGDTSLSPEDYRRSIDPLFDFVMEYTDNGIVNPGMEHEGEYFTGSFISREYIAYSEKRPQGKKESDKQYQQYFFVA